MSSESNKKKRRKVEEAPTSRDAWRMGQTEERIMLVLDKYKARKRACEIIDNDTLHITMSWKDMYCHECFEKLPKFNGHLVESRMFFRLRRFQYSKHTPLMLLRIHYMCMPRIIWKIATKQAYSLTVLSIQMRSFIRDILLRMHRKALETVVKKSAPKADPQN